MIYIFLGAGSGTRMGALTSDRAKVLVEVEGRPILEHTLRTIAAMDAGARVIIVAGYGAAAVERFVEAADWIDGQTVFNPDFATTGPLRSIEIGLAALPADADAITIGNGDTIFKPRAIGALLGVDAPAAMLVSAAGLGDEDDVQAEIVDHRVGRAAKRLAAAGTLPISAGLIRLQGSAAIDAARAAVATRLAEEQTSGRALTWHSVIATLAEAGFAPLAIPVPRESWWEFDNAENVALYQAAFSGGGRPGADPGTAAIENQ